MPRFKDDKGRVRKMTGLELEQAFYSMISAEPMSGCWLWMGNATKNGYGVIAQNYAHRLSYAMHNGEIGNLHVLHRCDNPGCVNPKHLFLGTQQDNNADKLKKGRASGGSMKGTEHHQAKLNDQNVIQIRERYKHGENQTQLAKAFSISQGTVWSIVNRKTWAHIV